MQAEEQRLGLKHIWMKILIDIVPEDIGPGLQEQRREIRGILNSHELKRCKGGFVVSL